MHHLDHPPWIISVSTQISFYFVDYIGLFIWIFGFFFKVISDYQKEQWSKTKSTPFLSSGLWSYSRVLNQDIQTILEKLCCGLG
jgi:steroid 5-alpha reductase family enzyme